MSEVTNIMITGMFDSPEEVLEQINTGLDDGTSFLPVKLCCTGGTKNLEANVFIAALNYMEYGKFYENIKLILETLYDDEKKDMQIMVKLPSAQIWKIVRAINLEMDFFTHDPNDDLEYDYSNM